MADAIDDFIALPQDQQLSTLQQLAPDKQNALLARVKQRRTSQPAMTATPDDRNFIQKGMDSFTTVLPSEERGQNPLTNFAQNLGASATGTLTAPIIHPVQTVHSLEPGTGSKWRIHPLGSWRVDARGPRRPDDR